MGNLFFARDAHVYVLWNSLYFEIPVLNGFSFSQATNASEITLNEAATAAGVSRRAKQVFNDSFAPAEWSFQTYVRPYIAAAGETAGTNGARQTDATNANHHAVEDILWQLMASNNASSEDALTSDTTNLDVAFDQSNKTTVGTCSLIFTLAGTNLVPTQTYQISSAVVNEATIDFDIDGIATITWSGFGSLITEIADITFSADHIYEGIIAVGGTATITNNYIRNRISTLVLTGVSPYTVGDYTTVLTGGSINFNNNITYLTPETLGAVNQPIGHVTGTRTVTGNFTAYLDDATDATADLWEDLIESTTVVTNDFNAVLAIGGASAPNLEITMATTHLEIPTQNFDDVVAIDCNFHALPSTIGGTDEAVLVYKGLVPA